jgi:hypothetical protein
MSALLSTEDLAPIVPADRVTAGVPSELAYTASASLTLTGHAITPTSAGLTSNECCGQIRTV